MQRKQKRAYLYRFYPTDEQARILARTFGCVRFAFNWALRHLERAFRNFFEGRAAYPKFKCKHGVQSATYTTSVFTWDGRQLALAKMEDPLHIIWSRPLPGGCKPTTVTVTKDTANRYFVSMLVEEDINALPVTAQTVGVDVGIKTMVALSSGEVVENPGFYVKADKRRDFQHKLSTRITRENQVICVESLSVKNMLKNHCLAKHISDVGWGEFIRQLEYKCAWYGRTFAKIDRWYPSSKTCSSCQHVLEILSLEDRLWTCPSCDTIHDRDINASKNILAEGLSVHACGGRVRPVRVRTRQASPVEAGSSFS